MENPGSKPTPDPVGVVVIPMHHPAWWVVALGVLLLSVQLGWRKLADWDVWWQLHLGRQALAEWSTLPIETYSWAMEGAPFPHKDLGGELLLWAAWALGSYDGMAALRALAAALLAVALVGVLPRAQRRPWVIAVGAGLLLVSIQDRVQPRALITSLVGFMASLALVEGVRRRIWEGRAMRPLLIGAVAMQLVWMNLHRGAMLGVVVWAGLSCALVLGRVLGRSVALSAIAGPQATWRQVGAVGMTAVGVAAVGVLHPSGWNAYRTGLAVTGDAAHKAAVSEWQPLSWEIVQQLYGLATGLVVAAAIALVIALGRALVSKQRQPVDVWHLGVAFVFFWQGVGSIRWMPEATIVAAMVLTLLLGALGAQRSAAGLPEVRLAALVLVLANLAAPLLTTQQPGRGDEAWRYPTSALEFARAHALGPRVQNAFVYGGYVLFAGWPTLRPMVDGRNDMVYPLDFYLACLEAQRDPAAFGALEAEHRPDWVLADNTPGRQTHGHLRGNPEWMMVHVTETAVVWVRRAEHPALASRALRYADPYAPVESLGQALQWAAGDRQRLAAIERELLQLLEDEPHGLRIHVLLVLWFDAMGPAGHARRDVAMQQLRAVWGDHPSVLELGGRLGI